MAENTGRRIVIVGAGPAGIRAAQTLVSAGLRPVLVDEAPRSGGQIYRRPPSRVERSYRNLYGFEAAKAKRLHEASDAVTRQVDYRPTTLVWGREGSRLLVDGPGGRDGIDFDAVILATGAMDRIVPVPGWTLPGVYSLGGAQAVIKNHASLIGRRPIFVGTGPLLYLVAWQYAKAGARPAAVIDAGRRFDKIGALPALLSNPTMLAKGVWFVASLRIGGVPLLQGAHAEAIEQTERGLRLRYRRGGTSAIVEGDSVAIGHGLKPEGQLPELLGCDARFDAHARLWLTSTDADTRTTVPWVYAAGDGVAIRGADAAEHSGELAALALLTDLGLPVDGARAAALRLRISRFDRFRRGLEAAFPYPHAQAGDIPDDTIVCRCEVVRAGELRQAAAQWSITEMNRLKAITRCGMGRCQGRICGGTAAEILARSSGRRIEEVGQPRAQAPLKPLTFNPPAEALP